MAIEDTRDDYILSLRYKLLVGAAYIALGTLAMAAGVWAGSSFTISRPQRGVGEETRPKLARVENSVAGNRPIAEYGPFGFREIDDDFLAMVVEQTGTLDASSAISGSGFGNVYDRKGRLIRRYAAIEDTESSWELIEFMRLPSSGPRINRKKNNSLGPSREPGTDSRRTRDRRSLKILRSFNSIAAQSHDNR
jgi:hypothetical protein